MRFNQPSYSHLSMGASQNAYFPFNVAALASMSNQQLEVSYKHHMNFSHSTVPQLIVTRVLRHLTVAVAVCQLLLTFACYCHLPVENMVHVEIWRKRFPQDIFI